MLTEGTADWKAKYLLQEESGLESGMLTGRKERLESGMLTGGTADWKAKYLLQEESGLETEC